MNKGEFIDTMLKLEAGIEEVNDVVLKLNQVGFDLSDSTLLGSVQSTNDLVLDVVSISSGIAIEELHQFVYDTYFGRRRGSTLWKVADADDFWETHKQEDKC